MEKSANTSAAVRNRREAGSGGSLDLFPTPPWATRALCHWLVRNGTVLDDKLAWDACAGKGHMVYGLRDYFRNVLGTDIHDHGFGYPLFDFLGPPLRTKVPWVVINPPFNRLLPMVHSALRQAKDGVAVFARTNMLESAKRYERLFKVVPPTEILQFSERVPLCKDVYDPDGTTATSYAWFLWRFPVMVGAECSPIYWLPPGTKDLLFREEDRQIAEGYAHVR